MPMSEIEQTEHSWRFKDGDQWLTVFGGEGIRIELGEPGETRSQELPQDAAESLLRWLFERPR